MHGRATDRQLFEARTAPNVLGPVLVAHERRRKRRYPIELRFRYEIHKNKTLVRAGVGTTIDVSSGGILLRSDEPLAVGKTVHLAIDWPFLLNPVCGLQLSVVGRVLRCDERGTALEMHRFEFRTCAASKPLISDPKRATENNSLDIA